MAVLETRVHELTIGKSTYETCQIKQRKASYWSPDRIYFPDGSFESTSVRVPDTSSVSCRYDMSEIDSRCTGCKQVGVGNAYNDMVKEKGA